MAYPSTLANTPAPDPYARDIARADEHEAPNQDSRSEYEPEFPAYLELLKDIPAPETYDLREGELRHMPDGNKDSGWQNCLHAVDKHDKELCQVYREQIDTLLVFAGLFSAVVTAFAIESYQWLEDDPLDTSVELLRDMVTLLSQNLNLTAPPTPIASAKISGPAVARINSFWFLSLTLSLSAALVGILCKQWLREFERNVGQSPEMTLAVRHIRFQGFEFWKVGSFITSVSIIMQMALALFLIGIVELLWCLHPVVACCVTVVAGLTLAFYLATTFLPVIQYVYICARLCVPRLPTSTYPRVYAFTEPQCAYKSAQAWLVFRILQPTIEYLFKGYGHLFSYDNPPEWLPLVVRPADSWSAFDINWVKRREHIHAGPRCAFETLAWIAENLSEMHLSSWVWHCVWARWLTNRHTIVARTLSPTDIESVARSYPELVSLASQNGPLVRSQALLYQCSLRSDLPVDTAIELFLRVAPAVGVTSMWTRDAIGTFLVVYHDLSFRLSDDLVVGLFSLAEQQTNAILLQHGGHNAASPYHGALAFRTIFRIIQMGCRSGDTFLTAMSGLALQWLRAPVSEPVALVARSVFDDMAIQLGVNTSRAEELHTFPGIILVAKLAGAVAERWPGFMREQYQDDGRRDLRRPIVRELLAICADGLPGDSRNTPGGNADESNGEGQPEIPLVPDVHPDEPDEGTSVVRADEPDDTTRLQTDSNHAASSRDSPVADG